MTTSGENSDVECLHSRIDGNLLLSPKWFEVYQNQWCYQAWERKGVALIEAKWYPNWRFQGAHLGKDKSEWHPPLGEENKRACRGRQCSADLVGPKSLFMVWSLWSGSTEQTWNVVSGPSKDQKTAPAVENGCRVSHHHDAKLPSLWIYLKETI